jgi:hypothetical protein
MMNQFSSTHRPLSLMALAVSLSLLSACGGGGSDAAPPPAPVDLVAPLNAGNYEESARIGLQAASFPLDAEALGGLLGPTAGAFSAEPMRRIAAALSSARPQAITSVDVPCPLGGRITTQFNDANNNRDFDAGDSVTLSYVDCKAPEGVLRGKMVVTMDTLSVAAGLVNATMRIESQDFRATAPNGDSAGGSGLFRISYVEAPSDLYTFSLEAAELSKSSVIAGRSSQHTVTSLRSAVTTSRVGGGLVSTVTASASLRSSVWGDKTVQVSSDPNWVTRAGDDYPSSGRILIRGAAGSQIRLVALNAQQVRIELDANGDGQFESSVTRNWVDLGV